MPGTTAPIVTNNVMRGPSKLFLNVALPAGGATLTLHTDGTPESVANPNAVYLGGTREGLRMVTEHTEGEETMDELPAPYRVHVTQERARIEGVMLEMLDFQRLAKLVPTGVYSTGSGYVRITSGGLLSITAIPIAAISEDPANAGKFIVFMLYAARNTKGLEIPLSGKSRTEIPFTFEGLSVPGRTAGDNLWHINKQT